MTAARVMAENGGRTPASLAQDRRGAVYVEFLAMIVPILAIFMGLAQTGGLYSAKLITQHSAVIGARAAAVVLADDPKDYGGVAVGQYSGARKEKIDKAVAMTLLASGSIIDYEVEVRGANGQPKSSFAQTETYPLATVRVEAIYSCTLFSLACGFAGMRVLEAEATMPVHLAPYTYPE